MAAMNNKQATIAGLEALGYKRTLGRVNTRKYVVYERENDAIAYLVGKSGALRYTRTTVANSVSITGMRIHKAFQLVGRNGPFHDEAAAWQWLEDHNAEVRRRREEKAAAVSG
jgi:hypothetical protein